MQTTTVLPAASDKATAAPVRQQDAELKQTQGQQYRGSSTAEALLRLQRTHGNRFVQRVIQAKLEVSHPGDPHEQEADQVADRIMSMPMETAQPIAQRAVTPDEEKDEQESPQPAPVQRIATSSVQKSPEEEDKEKKPDQTIAAARTPEDEIENGVLPHAEEAVSAASGSTGQPLPPALHRKFERGLGVDLSAVRVHTGPQSVEANKAISARAYTTGNDIHFNQGQYDPESKEGQRLLAHEVAHTVQQMGRVSRKHKLGFSLQSVKIMAGRNAGAMIGADQISVNPSNHQALNMIQRDDKDNKEPKKPPKPDPATLANPFDVPAVKVQVEKLAVDQLRALTGTLITQRYSSYLNAIDTVRREFDIKSKEKAEQDKLLVNAVLSIGLLAAGPAMAAIASKISGDALLTRVKAGVASNGPGWVKLAGIDDAEAAKYLTNEAYQKLSSDTLNNLASKFTTEKATKAVEFAADKFKDKTVELAVSTNKYECGVVFLEALKDAADASSTELLGATLGGMTSYDELLGVYNAFNAMSLAKFREQVQVQANHFMEQIAPLVAEKAARKLGFGEKGFVLLRVNAYGQPRLTLAIYSPTSATYIFQAWITPDMEKTAISTYGAPRDVEGSSFVSLPDPLRQKDKQRIVKIDFSGALRLAMIQVKDAGIISTELFYDFIRWIPESERADMEERAKSTQIGGLMTLPAAEVKNLKQPTD